MRNQKIFLDKTMLDLLEQELGDLEKRGTRSVGAQENYERMIQNIFQWLKIAGEKKI